MASDDGLYYKLTVAKAGTCVGEPREKSLPSAAKTPKYKAEATLEQRQLVHAAVEDAAAHSNSGASENRCNEKREGSRCCGALHSTLEKTKIRLPNPEMHGDAR